MSIPYSTGSYQQITAFLNRGPFSAPLSAIAPVNGIHTQSRFAGAARTRRVKDTKLDDGASVKKIKHEEGAPEQIRVQSSGKTMAITRPFVGTYAAIIELLRKLAGTLNLDSTAHTVQMTRDNPTKTPVPKAPALVPQETLQPAPRRKFFVDPRAPAPTTKPQLQLGPSTDDHFALLDGYRKTCSSSSLTPSYRIELIGPSVLMGRMK